MKKVLVAAPLSAGLSEFLVKSNYELIGYDAGTHSACDLREVVGIVTSNKLLLDQTALLHYPDLRWIARLGSGMEIIDTAWCDQQGIRYFSSPAGIANAVAEHVTGMLLSLLHKIGLANNQIREGHWVREANRGTELQSLTLGIIGCGHTGQGLLQKLSVFTDKILIYDKYKTVNTNVNARQVSLAELQQNADIISFHVPLNHETTYYYDDNFMKNMRKPHILINASRGKVAHTQTILQGLASGKISGACLDVLEEEAAIEQVLGQQNNIVQQLMQYNVVITPHIAGYSHSAVEKMCHELMLQIRQIT